MNDAQAESCCSRCQSLAVALQINVISRTASLVSPRNAAVAANDACSGCTTVARALQYTIPVADPSQVPQSVLELIATMDGRLKAIEHGSYATMTDAEAAINGVISQFTGLAQDLSDQRDARTN